MVRHVYSPKRREHNDRNASIAASFCPAIKIIVCCAPGAKSAIYKCLVAAAAVTRQYESPVHVSSGKV